MSGKTDRATHKSTATTLSKIDLREACKKFRNWGRWGPDDQLGTLNFITPEMVKAAAALVKRGKAFSLAVPYDENGPQTGKLPGRFNPIHLMVRDGNDIVAGTMVRDFYDGVDLEVRTTDDIIIMPLQCGTQWDALAHVAHEGKIYNGYDVTLVSSKGALRNDIAQTRDRVIGRGVLLDVARSKGKGWSGRTGAITVEDLDDCCRKQRVAVGTGDILLVRTGRMALAKAEHSWEGFADIKGSTPGLGFDTAAWLYDHQVAAVATDSFAVEVWPSQIPNMRLPLHIVCIVYMGMTFGETFDLEALAADCAQDGVYEFLFVGPPLPFSGAVGSPSNPIAIK